jgi:hypothetical protein
VAGFARKPVRGDGYSLRRAKEVLDNHVFFKFATPEEVAALNRKEDPELNLQREKRVGTFTKEELFTPVAFETLEVKREGLAGRAWRQGYWGVMVSTTDDVSTKGTVDWQVTVSVAGHQVYEPSKVRKYVVNNLGEEVYSEFKEALLGNLRSLEECLNEACQTLELKRKVGLSYVSSPSSERLLKRLGIRVERDWAFLFPHYTF